MKKREVYFINNNHGKEKNICEPLGTEVPSILKVSN